MNTSPSKRAFMETITCIDDLREAARRKVPRAFFDFVEGGSYSEQTLLDNRADFEGVKLRQRVLTDVASSDMHATIVGETASLPLGLAPIGLCGLQYADGEHAALRREPASRSACRPCRYAQSRASPPPSGSRFGFKYS